LATRPNFAKEVEQYRPRGYRPINISGFAYAGGHRFTTVYGPSNGHPWELTDGLTATELTGKFDTWRKSGYRLAVVYSYPDGVQTRFGAVFVQDTTFAGWEARVGLTGEEFREADDRMRKDGFRPDQVVGYDDGGTARYVGVWVRERSPLAVPFRPMTGTPVRELAAFDRAMQTYMRERDISAGTLAVMKDGKVILSRGYGYADKEGKTRTAPDELFRLASVSKPITAAGVRKLIQEGKLRPSNLVWDLLGLTPPPGKTADPRWKKVTVAHLLDHKGGWDRGVAGDPMFKPLLIAKALGKPGPATAEDVIAYMAGEPLQFEPGAKSVYSNFGYCVLGRVIEKVSGKKYIDYVRDDVLAPAGIKRIALGRTLPTDRDPAEPFYDDDGKGLNVMRPDQKEFVPAPDGSFHLEAMDAHGGLIGPADELVQFLKAYRVDGRPVGPKPVQDAFFGALPGTFTMLYQRGDGVAVVALFNRWHDAGGNDPFEIRRLIDQAADSIQSWPKGK
jgi:N-acyl-D-amino-acid deacylase